MSFNSLSGKTRLAGGIPSEILDNIFGGVAETSLAARSFSLYPMPTGVTRMAVLDMLPYAKHQNPAETGLGVPSDFAWANKEISAETVQVFLPVPKSVLEDSQFDIWGYVAPKCSEAIASAMDKAIFFGTDAPASFPTNLATQTSNDSANENISSSAAEGGFSQDLSIIEAFITNSGYEPDVILAPNGIKSKVRANRNSQGDRIADFEGVDSWLGMPMLYSGTLPSGGGGRVFMLDSRQYVLGIRRDIEMEVITEGVITDGYGKVVYNCAQQDGVILKVTFRYGWQRANSANLTNAAQAVSEVQTLTQTGVSSGSFYCLNGGRATNPVAFGVSAADLQTELELLFGTGNVTVSRSGSSGAYTYTLTFIGALKGRNVGQTTAVSTAGSIAGATTTQGANGVRVSAASLNIS